MVLAHYLYFAVLLYAGSLASNLDVTWDYVVVGAGSAGAVLAKELTDDKRTSVLLLEAGPNRDADPNVLLPERGNYVQDEPYYNFDYWSTRIKNLDNRRLSIPLGRMWGGCSSHNFMFYVRGNKYDYDRWALVGGDEWSPEVVMPIFMQMENNSLDNVENLGEFLLYHNTSGRLNTYNSMPNPELYETFATATHNVLGMGENPDWNGATQEGLGKFTQFTQSKMGDGSVLRESSSTAYLSSDIVQLLPSGDGIGVGGRKLRVNSLSYATTLIFEEDAKVVGINYIKNGKEMQARVRHDVILSAGAHHSPAILMRSGIGNCTELAQLGIECMLDNPNVGKNLQEHVMVPILGKRSGNNEQLVQGAIMGGFYKSSHADIFTDKTISKGETIVDSELYFTSRPYWTQDVQAMHNLYNIDPLTGELASDFTFALLSALMRPNCTGQVRLASRDPLAPPVIESNFLCDQRDFDWAVSTLRDLVDIVENMKTVDPTYRVVYPTLDCLSPEKINNTVRVLAINHFHDCGTVSMGTVVDGTLRVKGIKGLRVADASIMPFLITGNTNAPSMMIGRKAADLIRKERADLAGKCQVEKQMDTFEINSCFPYQNDI